jgi:segregation and condensation protein A
MVTPAPDYQVNLDIFRGPLDLLLYLVRREEIDIRDIPIARVAEQFKAYLDIMHLIDVERVGDFLVMAASLLEIKSKLLLPRPEESTEEMADPRLELVRQLLEYKKFKDATGLLEAQAERVSQRQARQPVPGVKLTGTREEPTLRPVELWDLVSAFGRLLRETLTHQPQTIAVDTTPLHMYMAEVETQLRERGRVPFEELFTPPHTRVRLIGLFLALLELTKQQRLVAEQPDPFGPIWVTAPETPAQEPVAA